MTLAPTHPGRHGIPTERPLGPMRPGSGVETVMVISAYEQAAGCWVATTEQYDGPGSPIGSSTQSELHAIQDLLDQLFDQGEPQ